MRCGDGSESFILRLLTRLATLWFVLQSLVMKKRLFPGSPDEILITVYAFDSAIRMLWFVVLDSCFQVTDFFPC